MSDGHFFTELKPRNVVRVAGLYLVGAWLFVQVGGTLLPLFDAPAWVMKTLVGLLAVGLVPALILAWAFEMTGSSRFQSSARCSLSCPRVRKSRGGWTNSWNG